LSLGNLKPELLASAQAAGDFVVRHINCLTADELKIEVNAIDLNNYQIALIDADLVRLIEPDDLVWSIFADARVAPVLVQDTAALEFEDISLRAAFASVIPSSPDFQTLRSAVRIGCSFVRQSYTEDTIDTQPCNSPAAISRKVLVADDNRTNRNVLATILESAGHKAVMVTDGDEAIDALEEGNFDVLLLDVNMPRLNGIDAASMWRQIEGGRSHLPIIGVTADATTETEARCLAAGMDIRITKPFDAKYLLSLIDKYTADNSTDAITAMAADPLEVIVPISGQKSNEAAVIDSAQISYLYSIGNQAFVDEMVSSFLLDITETIVVMRASISENDLHQFRFAAHSFKSSGQNIGAIKLSQLSAKLEHVTEAEFANDGNRYLAKIEELLLEIRFALTEETSNIRSAISR
jgi:two-component system, sensor histidine kinase RpfC